MKVKHKNSESKSKAKKQFWCFTDVHCKCIKLYALNI